jgi:hypothetical protein
MDKSGRYSESLDILTALVTYLALTNRKSRTAPGLATDLSLPQAGVEAACAQFPGIFRRSARLSPDGLPYYTLHARYAMRTASDDESDLPELHGDLLRVVLEFLVARAQAEQAEAHFALSLKSTERNARVAAMAALLSAVAAIAAVIVTVAVH